MLLPFLFIVLALPHLLYARVWLYPKDFTQLCSRLLKRPAFTSFDSVAALANTAIVLKVLQFATFLLWYHRVGPWPYSGALRVAKSDSRQETGVFFRTPIRDALAGFMIAFGQYLNYDVYRKLGRNGVYYGAKFGITVPWCADFPFSLVHHPQYVGCVLSITGVFLLLENAEHNPALTIVYVFWVGLYRLSAYIEDTL